MSDENTAMSYPEVEKTLTRMEAHLTPAEMHGAMTGWLSVISEQNKSWQSLLFPEVQVNSEIEKLFQSTSDSLQAPDFSFELLLPDDNEPLVDRGKALVNWCQGFLAGFGLTGFKVNDVETISESITDLAEIAKLDYQALTETSEDNEQAFLEVFEYVRTAAMLIYTEVHLKKSQATSSSDTVH